MRREKTRQWSVKTDVLFNGDEVYALSCKAIRKRFVGGFVCRGWGNICFVLLLNLKDPWCLPQTYQNMMHTYSILCFLQDLVCICLFHILSLVWKNCLRPSFAIFILRWIYYWSGGSIDSLPFFFLLFFSFFFWWLTTKCM